MTKTDQELQNKPWNKKKEKENKKETGLLKVTANRENGLRKKVRVRVRVMSE